MKKVNAVKIVCIASLAILTGTMFQTLNIGFEDVTAQNVSEPTAPTSRVSIDKGVDKISDALYSSVENTLRNRPSGMFDSNGYYIGSVRQEGNWALVSVSKKIEKPEVHKAYDAKGTLLYEESEFLGESILLIASTTDGKLWNSALEGTSMFDELLMKTPNSFVDANSKSALASTTVGTNAVSATTYKFPWPSGQTWQYRQGWHGSIKGLDMGTTSSDRRLLSSASGTVRGVTVCALSVNVKVQHSDGKYMNYLHIDRNFFDSSGIRNGSAISIGKEFGKLKPGTWSDACGYTSAQASNSAHVHWGIPIDSEMIIEGRRLRYSDSCFYSLDRLNKKCVGSSFVSTNTPR